MEHQKLINVLDNTPINHQNLVEELAWNKWWITEKI